MAQKTSVEWLVSHLNKQECFTFKQKEYIEQAKQMHKQEITKTAVLCHFEGTRQKAKNSEEYLKYAEEHYNQLFKKK